MRQDRGTGQAQRPEQVPEGAPGTGPIPGEAESVRGWGGRHTVPSGAFRPWAGPTRTDSTFPSPARQARPPHARLMPVRGILAAPRHGLIPHQHAASSPSGLKVPPPPKCQGPLGKSFTATGVHSPRPPHRLPGAQPLGPGVGGMGGQTGGPGVLQGPMTPGGRPKGQEATGLLRRRWVFRTPRSSPHPLAPVALGRGSLT